MPRTRGPKAQLIKSQKAKFLEDLNRNGGNVLLALETSGLPRRTAYDHYKKDPQFCGDWDYAIQASVERLYGEAVRRATTDESYGVDEGGRTVFRHRRASDRLLMFLIKRGEREKKWEYLCAHIGNTSLRVIQEKGFQIGIPHSQIEQLKKAMLEAYDEIRTD